MLNLEQLLYEYIIDNEFSVSNNVIINYLNYIEAYYKCAYGISISYKKVQKYIFQLYDIINDNNNILSILEKFFEMIKLGKQNAIFTWSTQETYDYLINTIKEYFNIYIKIIDPLFYNTESSLQVLCENTILKTNEDNELEQFEFKSDKFKFKLFFEISNINNMTSNSFFDTLLGLNNSNKYVSFVNIDITNIYTNTNYEYSFTNNICDINDDIMKTQFISATYDIIYYIKRIIMRLIELITYSRIGLNINNQLFPKIITTEKLKSWITT